MARETRKPTGLPSWPLLLLAAGEKKGKTYAAMEASASELVGGAYVVSMGEDDPDEYALIPGARFEIMPHDGTHRDALDALREASAMPRLDPAKPNLLVLDGAGRWWGLLSDMANETAHRRAKKAAEKYNKRYDPDDEVTVHPDLWNIAKNKWYDVVDVLRAHDGPVICTALLENQVVMDAAGKPTKDRHWQIKTQKLFPSDVGVVCEAPEYREWYVTGLRSVRREPVKTGIYTPDNRFPDFTVDALWRVLGLAEKVGQRVHNAPDREGDAILVAEIEQAVAQAVAVPLEQRLAALQEVWNTYGKDTMNSTPVAAPDGSQITGAALITGWVNATRAEIDRAQQAPPAAPPAAAAADSAPARADAHALLMDEIQGMAATLRINPVEFVKPLIDKHEGAQRVKDIPAAQVLAFVAFERPRVVAALHEQGEATAANAYAKVPSVVWGTWEQLTSPADTEQAAAPVNA